MEPKSWATLAFLAILLWRPICTGGQKNYGKKKHKTLDLQQETGDIQSFLTADKTILIVDGGFTGTLKPCCGNGSKTTTTVNQTMWSVSFDTTSTTLQPCRGKCPLIENKTTNCSVSCFNTTTLCNGTAYKQESCKDLFSGAINQDKFIIDATAPNTCFNCNEPFQDPVEQLYPTATFTTEKGVDIDGEKASKAMNDISSLVKDMNESSASVFMGSVTGVIVKPKDKDIEEVSFGYSSSSSIKIVEDREKLGAFSRSVSVTKEAFEKAFKLTNSSAFAGVFRFPNMSKDANNSTVLHNEVVAIEMGTIIANLTDHINLNFRNVQKGGAIPSCQSWDGKGSRPNWTDDGCLTFVKGDNITCECTHLTFFAVLMSPPNQTISDSDLNSLTYITYVGCGMSMFFLGVVLFMHFLLRKAKSNKTTRILIQLFLSMFMLNVTFLSNEWVASLNSPVACQMMAAAMHYSMLSTFTWFAVEAFHLGQQLFKSGAITIPRYIMKVCIAGWVLPSVVVIILFSLGKYGKQSTYTDGGKVMYTCWILDIDVHYIVNIGYYALVFLFTFTTFIVVLRWLFYLKSTKIKTKLGMDQAQQQGTGTKDVVTVMGLCCLLGITWSFAFFAHGVLKVPSYYIFTILNSFQGFFMFLYYYNTSRVIGETTKDDRTSSKCSTLSNTVNTTQENPYVDLGQRHPYQSTNHQS